MQLENPQSFLPHKSQIPHYLFYYQHCKEPIYQLIPIPNENPNEDYMYKIHDYVKFILGVQEDPLQTKPAIDCCNDLGQPLCPTDEEIPLPTNLFQHTTFTIKRNNKIEREGENETTTTTTSTTTTTTGDGYQRHEDIEDPIPTYTQFTQPQTITALQWATMVGLGEDLDQPPSPASDLDSKTLIRTLIDYYIDVLIYSDDGSGGQEGTTGMGINQTLSPDLGVDGLQNDIAGDARRRGSYPNLNYAHTRSVRPAPTPNQQSTGTKHDTNEDDEKADFKYVVKI